MDRRRARALSPAWDSQIDGGEAMDAQTEPTGSDTLAQPEPESIFD